MTDADKVIGLPNVGRERGTYLHHLAQVYDDPPKYTMFSQAAPAGQNVFGTLDTAWEIALRQLGDETGFLELCEEAGGDYGQFVVSGERIKARPRWIYEYLGDLVNVPEDRWMSGNGERGMLKKAEGRKSLFEPIIEKLWTTLFGCAGQGDGEGCQTSCLVDS